MTDSGRAAPERTLFVQLAVSAPGMGIVSLIAGEPSPDLTQVSAFTFLTPVCGLIAGVVLLADPVAGELMIGPIGVAVGLWLVNRR